MAAISAAAALPLVSGSDAVCLFTSKAIRLHNSLPHNPIDRIGSTKYTHCNFTESLQYRLRAKRSESRLTPGNDNKRCREAESRSRFTAAWARRRVRAAACTKDRDVCEPGEPRTQRRHQGRVTFYTVFGLSFQYRDDGLNLNQFYVFSAQTPPGLVPFRVVSFRYLCSCFRHPSCKDIDPWVYF